MAALEQALDYARRHAGECLEDLKAFLRIPSISTEAGYQPEVARAAAWLAGKMQSAGLTTVEVVATAGHPVVYGEWLGAGPAAPTVLYYGHYDVQPVDPLPLWHSDPFEPVERGKRLYARGVSDMKSLVIAHLKATEAWLQTTKLPVNVKYLIEGEEEVGSRNLEDFIETHQGRLACTLLLNGDAGILGPETPSLTYGLRGIAYFELTLEGPRRDLHSGRFGGVVRNPALTLCQLLGGMYDEQGHVTVPGFYDAVVPLSAEEREAIAQLPTEEAWWQAQTDCQALFGEAGYSSTERASVRPTFDVNGFSSGFTGEGSKTVIPARARAKFSMRLVPDQTPEAIHSLVQTYLEAKTPPGMHWELKLLHGGLPVRINRQSAPVEAASQALRSVWGKPPLFWHAGGTVPIMGRLQRAVSAESLMLGFFLHNDNIHAPNESFYLPNFYRGIETYIRFLYELAKVAS